MATAVLAAAGAAILLAVVIAGLVLMPEAQATDLDARSLAPSLQHPFGTDRLGHDMLVRTVAGLSTSILIGLVAVAASSLIALALGCASALGGRKVDAAITWIIDLMMGVPHIILLILISYALGKGFVGVVVGIALTHWPSLARVVRAEVLQVKEAPYVAAAAKLGRSRWDIALRHILPHVLPQFLVGIVLMFPHAILHEAAITFLGFGLSPESAAIGIILSEVDELPLRRHVVARVLPRTGVGAGRHDVRRVRIGHPPPARSDELAGVGGGDGREDHRHARIR